jgi:hypothetical protein
MLRWFAGAMIFAVVTSSETFSQQSLQQLESMDQFGQALAAVDQIKRQKKFECVLAIGNRALCDCLAQKLPVDTHFRSYALIVNQERRGPEYGKLSVADRNIVDQCVTGPG